MRGIGRAVLAGLLALPAVGLADPAWVEMTGDAAEARTVTTAAACPNLIIDGRTRTMRPRGGPTAAFPSRVCAAAIPAGARRIQLGGERLPAPAAQPRRLVILGDTGCRLKGWIAQSCNDPKAWPFARVAARAARDKPDLVIHVGDYYYRETPCPPLGAACRGSPSGDRWASWKADLFDPAAPLFAAAPWVFARGNHEDCKRGGPGWFRLLDAAPSPLACPATSAPFQVRIAGARLVVVDSADTEDAKAPPDAVAAFRAGLVAAGVVDPARAGSPAPAWIITHRPIWYARRDGENLSDGGINATERAAARRVDLAPIQLVVSGHVHNFTSVGWVAGVRPPQLVVGAGGDLMAPNDAPPPVAGWTIVDGLAARVLTMGRFGYLLLDRGPMGWSGVFKDADGRVIARCGLVGRALECRAA